MQWETSFWDFQYLIDFKLDTVEVEQDRVE